MGSLSRLRGNTFSVVRPGPRIYRGCRSFSRKLYLIPKLYFSVRKFHLKFNGNCCSEFLRGFSKADIKLYCSGYVRRALPSKIFSHPISTIVARGCAGQAGGRFMGR